MEQTDWIVIAETIGLIGGVILGVKVAWTLANRAYRNLIKMFGIGDLRTDIEALSGQVAFLVSEMHPNGGTSIRDSLNRIEADVSLANERQRARMLDTPEMIFETDCVGDCIWVNRTYTRAVQRALSELLGRGWVNGIATEDRDTVVSEWYTSVNENREFEMTFNFQTPDGSKFPVMCRSYRMCSRDGTIIGYLGHCEKL